MVSRNHSSPYTVHAIDADRAFSRVSYDDEETWQLKKQYAADKCLAGTLEWAVDMNDVSSKGTKETL